MTDVLSRDEIDQLIKAINDTGGCEKDEEPYISADKIKTRDFIAWLIEGVKCGYFPYGITDIVDYFLSKIECFKEKEKE